MKMKNEVTYLYNYRHATSNEVIYPTTIEVNRIDMVIKSNLYTLEVAKIVKHGYEDKDGYEFIITTYFLESVRV
jgi:hypothetical protein